MQTTDALNLEAGYIPLPAQQRFHESEAKFRCYSGGFGSGKSMCGCREAIVTAFMYPGSSGFVGRLRMKDLELTTMKTFWEQLGVMGLNRKPYVKNFSAKLNEITFGNGSTIIFSGLDDEMKLRSMQLSWAYVDEGSEVPEVMFRTLIGRLRWGMPRRLWTTTNPGASGWIRQNFIDNRRHNYDLFHAPTKENIHLPKDYIQSLLDEYPEVWVKRYLEGSWDAFEGQVFTMADPRFHLFDGIWRPTKNHLIYEGWDFGYRNPTHVSWTAWHPSGTEPLVTFAEHAASEWTPERHAKVVQQIRAEFNMPLENIISFGDPAGAQVQGLTGLSYFDEYANHGIGISPSVKEPSIRAIRLAKWFEKKIWDRDLRDQVPAWVFIKQYTRRTWGSVISYRYKENRSQTGEDAPEQFHKENDHGVDSLGYAIHPIPLTPEDIGRRPRLPVDPVKPRTPFDDEDLYDDSEGEVTLHGVPI